MKNVQVKSHFKKVSDKSSAKYGEKRPDLHWSYDGLEVSDFGELDQDELVKIAALANSAIEAYGRKILLQNADDWNFDPTGSVDYNNAYQDLTSTTTRKRKVTKETLAKCGEFYIRWAGLIDKSDKAANAGASVIAQKLAPIAANPDALEVMKGNLLALIDKAGEESTDNIKLAEELEANADCLEWLVNECEELVEASKMDLADSL